MPRWSQFKKASLIAAGATTIGAVTFLSRKMRTQIKGNCEFSEHTRKQMQENLLSGMHQPFITKDKESLDHFHQHFDQFSDLLPTSVEKLQQQRALKAPVKITRVNDCPVPSTTTTLVVVGGLPALITAAANLEKGIKVVYLNDERIRPISDGSAFHLEQDADAEAPTSETPINFMKNQLLRATIKPVSYEQIEKTGEFPWKSLDWVGCAQHTGQWLPAFRVAIEFQKKKMQSASLRQTELEQVSHYCGYNEKFYNQLNENLGGKLLLPGTGSIIVARNPSEVDDLYAQQKNLAKEGRTLNILSNADLKNRYGFSFEGMAFAEKTHDKVLSPFYKSLLCDYIKQKGGTIINGTLDTVYVDGKKTGGVAQYRDEDGQQHDLTFGRLVMSLGNQEILDFKDKPLFDVIGATGSSGLALVYTPVNYKLPRVSVFGATNHVTLLSTETPSVIVEGKPMHLNLIRFTAGACITPAYRGKEGGDYDSTISLGLVNTVYKTLGPDFIVKPLTVVGCNRVVSGNGQTAWIQPYPGIDVQFGAGGGGLTRAPDLVTDSSQTKPKSF